MKHSLFEDSVQLEDDALPKRTPENCCPVQVAGGVLDQSGLRSAPVRSAGKLVQDGLPASFFHGEHSSMEQRRPGGGAVQVAGRVEDETSEGTSLVVVVPRE